MKDSNALSLDRRAFTAGLGAIVVAFSLDPEFSFAQQPAPLPGDLNSNRMLDAWLRINADEMLKVLGALERLPEGKEWVDRNRERFKSLKPLLAAPRDDATSKKPDDSVVQIEMMLRNLGIDPETLK